MEPRSCLQLQKIEEPHLIPMPHSYMVLIQNILLFKKCHSIIDNNSFSSYCPTEPPLLEMPLAQLSLQTSL